ncbi:2,3-bisphosphoglycerate-dependent phosphoglycerate mutase [Flavobacterium frigoris]|uniref:2,3-bisphosphoglycerate-dependent phosphoglycerate mutase n=1 Tax=Flavobacterium frigoris (strain PS1) TaxID=1086011 RepID=H7FWH7_FLAFP|nr:2,3-bisphosphoglycerate-dependent phosphoglycerate mutase [Flavobacterium frigoris]EIA07149.1 phosphoglycerate mutase [Flavobacterium frigoris PS1]
MSTLIILRHGQSTWNLENRFTGEVDIDLSPYGEAQAKQAGILLKNYNIKLAFTSVLKRAIRTLSIVLKEIDMGILVFKSKALNERNYGDLQGLNKTETENKFGAEQVHEWRRSFNARPPNGESLKDTFERTIPYFLKEIEPQLQANKNVLIVAHGNSLRAIMMYLEKISETEIAYITLATGIPRVYEFTSDMKLHAVHYLS